MHIKRLKIDRYRGLEEFEWDPAPGINCLIGPGDAGKSTVLAAISLLLAPYHVSASNEFDYYQRKPEDGFEIYAVLGGFDEAELAKAQGGRIPAIRKWEDDQVHQIPDGGEPCLEVRVKGTPDLEVIHEIVEGLDPETRFPVAARRLTGLVRLYDWNRTGRDLRFTQGSLLERQIGRADLRPVIQKAVSGVDPQWPQDVADGLDKLKRLFEEQGLPKELFLGLTAQAGSSLSGSVSLLAGEDANQAVPLANWGLGTRQSAILAMASDLVEGEPIFVADEIESGLEPYRQRAAVSRIANLIGDSGQAFLTTHSPAVVQSLPDKLVWRMNPGASPFQFSGRSVKRLIRSDPEAFFAPLVIVCEGLTEMGLLSVFLPELVGINPEDGRVKLVDGNGQPASFATIRKFSEAGVSTACILDNESREKGRRERASDRCAASFVWRDVENIERAVSKWLPTEAIGSLIEVGAEARGLDVGQLVIQVNDRLPAPDRLETPLDLDDLLGVAHQGAADKEKLRDALYQAMLSGGGWFKTEEAGAMLADFLIEVGLPLRIKRQMQTFLREIRALIE